MFNAGGSLLDNWRSGPVKDTKLEPGHGRGVLKHFYPQNFYILQILCLAVNDKNIVTGSGDHGLRVYDL